MQLRLNEENKIIDRAENFKEAWSEEIRAKMADPNDSEMLRAEMAQFISFHDCRDAQTGEAVVAQLNEEAGFEKYAVSERGGYPKYSIFELPQVGDPISYGFNGDYYPCGEIKSISATKKLIVSTTGAKFYRRNNSASWVKNGTWSMVAGHIDERNPHF